MRRMLIILVFLLCLGMIARAQETIVDFGDRSLPVLNEELRKLWQKANDATVGNTGVTPGTYTLTTLTVSADGRISHAENGTIDEAIYAQLSDLAWTHSGSYTTLVNAGDNVGVGTAAPSRKLDVNGAVAIPTDNAIYFEGGSGNTYVKYNSGTSYFEFFVDGTIRAEW